MVTGPGYEPAVSAADRGCLRVSDAEREQVIGPVKAAFVRGMLAKDEFDLRVSQAFRRPASAGRGWPGIAGPALSRPGRRASAGRPRSSAPGRSRAEPSSPAAKAG